MYFIDIREENLSKCKTKIFNFHTSTVHTFVQTVWYNIKGISNYQTSNYKFGNPQKQQKQIAKYK